MQQMAVYGVSFDLVGKQPIVLLKTVDGNRFLPIWIGHPEAAAILMKLQNASTPRPMTHDLVTDILSQLDAQVVRVAVTELRENTFFAQVTIQQDGSEIEVDSRPSDAIALAVRVEAPIFVMEFVLWNVRAGFAHGFAGRPNHAFQPARPLPGIDPERARASPPYTRTLPLYVKGSRQRRGE